MTIDMGVEVHAFFFDLSESGEGKYLKAAGIGEDRTVPVHKPVEPAELFNQLVAGPDMKMVGVGKLHLCPDPAKVIGGHSALDRGDSSYIHEYRRMDYVVKVIERHVEKAKNNLKGSPIIVAGGYGVGSKENFDLLFDLAKELHAEVGASRAAVDAGFADHDRQIGQTGVTVRPKLYIACGISGQIQHIAGMQESGIIISINNDPDAPINTIADYVINGTIEEVVPKMIKYYKQNSK